MKSVLVSLVILVLATVAFSAVPAFAQDAQNLTDDQITQLKTNCQNTLVTLGRIHADDAPTYINSNQTYFSISDKLMARLNSRLALNRYDATPLVKVASDFNNELTTFRNAYKNYDDTVSDALKIDCRREPVSFYDKITDARDKRQKVQDAVTQLKTSIDQYSQAIKTFRTQHQLGDHS